MKKLVIFLLLAAYFSSPVLAQDKPSPRFHEFGIIFYDLYNFGLRYKYGSEKTKLRLSLLSTNLALQNTKDNNNDQNGTTKSSGFGAGLRIGFDQKVPLFGAFSLLLGAEAGLSYEHGHDTWIQADTTLRERTMSGYSPSVSFIFGANYVIKDHLVLGAEINPTLYYTYSDVKYKDNVETDTKSNRIGFSLSTAGAGLYIAYRFGK